MKENKLSPCILEDCSICAPVISAIVGKISIVLHCLSIFLGACPGIWIIVKTFSV